MFSLPSVVPVSILETNKPVRKWEYKKRNGIHHWTSGLSRDFSVYNRKLPQRTVSVTEGDWSVLESNYLLELVHEYDARFSIIHDRYEFPGSSRSLTDLKERYCQIERKFLVDSKEEAQKFSYNKFKEDERRRNLEILYSRSDSALKEEEILFKEIKRRQVYQESWEREHDEIVRVLKDHRVDAPSVPPSTLASLLEKKKRKSSIKEEVEYKRKRPSFEGSRESLDDLLTKKSPSTYLRSTKMLPVKSGLQSKVNTLLEEVGVPVKPKMATVAIIAKYDELREKAKDILEMKKQLEKIEHDLKVVKIRKGELPDDQLLNDDSVGSVGKKGLVAVLLFFKEYRKKEHILLKVVAQDQ